MKLERRDISEHHWWPQAQNLFIVRMQGYAVCTWCMYLSMWGMDNANSCFALCRLMHDFKPAVLKAVALSEPEEV